MVRPERDQLRGEIEVDETYIGGKEIGNGKQGRGAETKTLVVVATECIGKQKAHELLHHVHIVDSFVKRWLNGTHQGNVSPKHLPYYLNEFAFRFNRKMSTYRGKLFYRLIQQAIVTSPVPINEIVKQKN